MHQFRFLHWRNANKALIAAFKLLHITKTNKSHLLQNVFTISPSNLDMKETDESLPKWTMFTLKYCLNILKRIILNTVNM